MPYQIFYEPKQQNPSRLLSYVNISIWFPQGSLTIAPAIKGYQPNKGIANGHRRKYINMVQGVHLKHVNDCFLQILTVRDF